MTNAITKWWTETIFNIINSGCLYESQISINIYSFADAAKKAIDGDIEIAEVLPRLIIIYATIDDCVPWN